MLKYLFTAIYKDGTRYTQNEQDISIKNKERSCFFDVEQDKLAKFMLSGERHTYAVNLVTGNFEIDGNSFGVFESTLKKYRVIFWRQHTHSINMVDKTEVHKIRYCIGWQANDERGKNHQRIIYID